ncbi:MAG: hypothetical protein WC717_02465 [Candidatus Micrarchaeia archaeon]|jgi:outer membrane murein-binding lipoprotein Lpp
MEMTGYRQIAERHGNRWLRSREIGVRQRLRKGIGDASGLQGKLAILLEVKEQRAKVAGKIERKVNGLGTRVRKLADEKDRVEQKLMKAKEKMSAAKGDAYALEQIAKHGVQETGAMKRFWSRMLEMQQRAGGAG